jgi:hypothetical protein
MTRTIAALACAGALLGCGGPSWPRPVAVADPRLVARSTRVATVDIVPVDLAVLLGTGQSVEPEQLRATSEAQIMTDAIAALEGRGFTVGALVDWNGDVTGRGNVMAKSELRASVGAMSRYGAATQPGMLPAPLLPARLGAVTGSDATLFVSGWSFVAAPHVSTANKVAAGITLGLVSVAVIGTAAVVGAAIEHQAGGRACRHGFEHAVTHVIAPEALHPGAQLTVEATLAMTDAFARVVLEPSDAEIPQTGPSQTYLAMTLVDNRTGRALWHTHQVFPASPREIARAARTLLASLPSR